MTQLNQSAQAALAAAVAEARSMKHNYVGQEHLLLGLAADQTNTAVRLFASVGASGERVQSAMRHVIGEGAAGSEEDRPYTPRMQQALALAEQEAARLNEDEVDTAHLVLGMLSEGHGIGAGLLASLGLTLDSGRETVTRLMSEDDANT
jgi:ATP-dependent Clp protease ATP-binding subunit ClpC